MRYHGGGLQQTVFLVRGVLWDVEDGSVGISADDMAKDVDVTRASATIDVK